MFNEMRSFKNRGFHDGYEEAKGAVLQEAYDSGYKEAFEQNFILSTLKGVASALKTSYNSSTATTAATTNTSPTNTTTTTSHTHQHHHHQHRQQTSRPTSVISTASTPSTSSSASSPVDKTPQSTTSSSNATSFSSSSSVNVNISSNHLKLLNSMKFDGTTDIESIKKDLITICRENRLEILAHYVSQIG